MTDLDMTLNLKWFLMLVETMVPMLREAMMPDFRQGEIRKLVQVRLGYLK